MTPIATPAARRSPVRRAGVLATVAIVGIFLVLLWPGEERRVRQRVAALADAVSIPENEADLARLARAQRVRTFLRPEVTVRFARDEWPAIEGRDVVAGLVARPWVSPTAGVRVEIEDVEARFETPGRAEVRFRARVVATDETAEPAALDGRLVALSLDKVDGEWMVAAVRIAASDDSEVR